MERTDHKVFNASQGRPMQEEEAERATVLKGQPREIELIIRGLRALRGLVVIRKQTDGITSNDDSYTTVPSVRYKRVGELPTSAELDHIIKYIEYPRNVVEDVVEAD